MAKDTAGTPKQSGGRCPICSAPAAQHWRPFCSRRCTDLDLGRWLTGAYAIPSDEDLSQETDGTEE